MYISIKKHNQKVNELETKISELKQDLAEARNLKSILEKFSDFSVNGIHFGSVGGSINLNLPDTVLEYTEDILGGKVIKQEGIKCLIIKKDGSVEKGLTKQKPDKGYTYKLIRE